MPWETLTRSNAVIRGRNTNQEAFRIVGTAFFKVFCDPSKLVRDRQLRICACSGRSKCKQSDPNAIGSEAQLKQKLLTDSSN
jgi:hypothetical protein